MNFSRLLFALQCLALALSCPRAEAQSTKPGGYPRQCTYPTSEMNEAQDDVLAAWKSEYKFYLIMGATGGQGDKQQFAPTDAADVEKFLTDQGYQPIPNAPFGSVLVGDNASWEDFNKAVDALGSLPDTITDSNPLVLFYYSGHGEVGDDPATLEIWPSGPLSSPSTLFVEVLHRIRKPYKRGRLVVVLDACFSGQAIKDLAMFRSMPDTAVLASSSSSHESSATCANGKPGSAFTCALSDLLNGAEVDSCRFKKRSTESVCGWDDGIALIPLVRNALATHLKKQGLPQPVVLPFAGDPGMLAYFCESARNPDSQNRQDVLSAAIFPEALRRVADSLAKTQLNADNGILRVEDDYNNVLGLLSIDRSQKETLLKVSSVSGTVLRYAIAPRDGVKDRPNLRIVGASDSVGSVPLWLSSADSQIFVKELAEQFSEGRAQGIRPLGVSDLKKMTIADMESIIAVLAAQPSPTVKTSETTLAGAKLLRDDFSAQYLVNHLSVESGFNSTDAQQK